MLFYFDFTIWFKLIRLAAQEKNAKRRVRFYRYLLLSIPLRALGHAILFFFDGILFPGLWFTRIEKPVFIIGHGRSGTTLTHRLMCADQRFSAFKFYELVLPSLIEKKLVGLIAWVDRVCLGRRIEKRLAAWEDRKFGPLRHIHNQGLTIYEEDEGVLFSSCASGVWSMKLPNMNEIDFFHVDQRPPASRRLTNHYRNCVRRQLYLNGGHLTHLSKSPTFSGHVAALIEAFPDARFVVMYRNPYETIPSLLKLMYTAWNVQGDLDQNKLAASTHALVEISYDTYLHPEVVLSQHPEVRHADVDYRKIVAEPKATVEQIYADLGIPMTEEFRATLQKEQEQTRQHKTEHRYSMEEFGLDSTEIRRRLAPLFERFGWDAEQLPPAPTTVANS